MATNSGKKSKQITKLEKVQKQANDLFTDIKAEVFVAYLIEQGYASDYISISRKGSSSRGWNKDIGELAIEYSQYDLKDYLNVKINRASIYDILPEGLFHGISRNKRLVRDKENIINDIKKSRKEEFFVRRFFQLFENEFDMTSVKAHLHEAKYDKKISNPDFTNIFISYWPVIKLLQRRQAIFFLHTVALLDKLRNQLGEVAQAMSLILDVPVKITQTKILHKDVENQIHSELGNHELGIDWILGRSFDDGLFDLKVTLGPISGEEMRSYLGEAQGSIVLDSLCKLLLPGNVFVIKDYIIAQKEAVFKLSNQEHTSYLGINTFL